MHQCLLRGWWPNYWWQKVGQGIKSSGLVRAFYKWVQISVPKSRSWEKWDLVTILSKVRLYGGAHCSKSLFIDLGESWDWDMWKPILRNPYAQNLSFLPPIEAEKSLEETWFSNSEWCTLKEIFIFFITDLLTYKVITLKLSLESSCPKLSFEPMPNFLPRLLP